MKLRFFLALLLFISLSAHGQKSDSKDQFYGDFKKALDKNFSEKALNKMSSDHLELLTPHSDATQLIERLKGEEVSIYPLSDFKNSKLYIDNINYLLQSVNPNHRILAYLVIASSGDKTKEDILLKKIKSETSGGNLIWAGMALLYLNSSHTTALFDFRS